MDAVDRCNNYISGSLFNPELAIHENVRDMIIDCRDQMVAQKAEIERLRKDKAELLKMLNQMLDDMGATGHSVCGAVKAMGRYIIAKHQTDEEAFLDYTIHQAVKVLLEVDMISEEQAKTAIAKATGGK